MYASLCGCRILYTFRYMMYAIKCVIIHVSELLFENYYYRGGGIKVLVKYLRIGINVNIFEMLQFKFELCGLKNVFNDYNQ